MDITKLKVPDLKKELKNRGLNVSGNKNELIERLQSALKQPELIGESVDDLDEDLLNEDEDDDAPLGAASIGDIDAALGDAPPDGALKRRGSADRQPPKKLILNRSAPVAPPEGGPPRHVQISAGAARPEPPAGRPDAEARRLARVERFGAVAAASNGSSAGKIDMNVTTSVDVLKQRAERFGGSVSNVMTKIDVQDKLEKRKARFGIVTDEDKAKQRLERFKQPIK